MKRNPTSFWKMHRHFSKSHFRSKWILKQFNTAFPTAFHMHGFVHACKAALGCSSREAMSIQGCGAGRQPTHTVRCSAQIQQARQGQQAVEQTTTLVGLVSCYHACIDAKLPTPLVVLHPTLIPHPALIPQKHFFIEGCFL